MYSVDSLDTVVTMREIIPVPDPGSPDPVLLATDSLLVLVYSRPGIELGQAGPDGRMMDPEELPPDYEAITVVRFSLPRAHFFGPPNDEAISGHPLFARGLAPYGTYEVRQSSWIRELERRNRAHDRHDPRRYERLRHFVIAFHDSTFECIADRVEANSYDTNHPAIVGALRAAIGSVPG